MHFIGSSKIKIICMLVTLILCVAVAGCAGAPGEQGLSGPSGPPGEQGPSGPPAPEHTACIVVVPNVIDTAAETITVYGSGFTPGEEWVKYARIMLEGTFYFTRAEVTIKTTDVVIAAVVPNEWGRLRKPLKFLSI